MQDVSEDGDAHLCEAVLRSVFALGVPVRSLDDRLQDAEAVKRAFALESLVYNTVSLRAQKAAQYRRAELQLRIEALERDELPLLNTEQFEDSEEYKKWKQKELEDISTLVTTLGTFPHFSGSVQVDLISAENLKALPMDCQVLNGMSCKRSSSPLKAYCSVTVLPEKSGSRRFEEEPSPSYLTSVFASTGSAQWQAVSPWMPVTSVQDKVLIEVWNREDGIRTSDFLPRKSKLKYLPFITKSSSKELKVAPWNGDSFLGQVIVSFSQIESQALSEGVMQGKAPLSSFILADEKGRQKSSHILLQFSCSSERVYRDIPPNHIILSPPVADTKKAYDVLVTIALRSQKEGTFNLEGQWRNIVLRFGSHYRLRNERCSLGIVINLARYFQQDLRYLEAIVNEWVSVYQSARTGRLTEDEHALHKNVISLVRKPAEDTVQNFQAIFPANQPPGAVSDLLKLLGLAWKWNPDPKEISIPLRGWIKNSCEKRFYQHMFGDDASSSGQPTAINARSLHVAVKHIREDLAELQTSFKDTFPENIFLPAVAAPAYYKLVAAYVVNTVRAAPVKIFTKEYETLVVELFNLHGDIQSIGQECEPRCEFLDLHGIFKDHVIQFIADARSRMIDWVSSSVSSERWEPLSPQTGALFSFSVVDMYFMIGEVMNEMLTRLTAVPFGIHYFENVEDAVCIAVKTYVEIIERLCLQELPAEPSKDKRAESTDLCISKSVSVKMNNMYAVLEQQLDLEKRIADHQQDEPAGIDDVELSDEEEEEPKEKGMEKLDLFTVLQRHGSMKRGLGKQFQELRQFTHRTINNIIGCIVEQLQSRISVALHCVFGTMELEGVNLREQLQPLTSYLDQHLIIMNEFLNPKVFQQVIIEICKTLIFAMEEFALNREKPMSNTQRQKLGESIAFLYDYFYGDGSGINSQTMDAVTARLQKILSCWDLSTRELSLEYWQAWERFNQQRQKQEQVDGNELHLLDYVRLLLLRSDDEEAREIVEHQSFTANEKMMQFMFGLPKEEALVASFACRNVRKSAGTLFVTAKHVCFADDNVSLKDTKNTYVISMERLMRIEQVGSCALRLIPFNQRRAEFNKFVDRDSVCRTVYAQVVGSGTHLEKNLAPHYWSEKGDEFIKAIKVFKCCKQGILHQCAGTLLVTSGYILFTSDEKQKKMMIQIEHSSIAKIHAQRRGFRASGVVVVQLKNGEEYEFCEFGSVENKDIAKELQKLVLGIISKT